MKKTFIFTIICMMSLTAFSQTHLYVNPGFKYITKDHRIIGILPFKSTVLLRPKEMKALSHEQLEKIEEAEGKSIQSAMYTWYLVREMRGDLKVKLQSVAATNAKLKKAGITYENLEYYTPDSIAKILEVDAIIMGTYETTKPTSEAAAVVLGMFTGFFGKTNKAVINLYIYNGEDGELLANYNKGVSGSIGSTSEKLVNKLMRKASRRIGY
jgi:hypothetical protein